MDKAQFYIIATCFVLAGAVLIYAFGFIVYVGVFAAGVVFGVVGGFALRRRI